MTGGYRTGSMGRAAMAAAVLVLCLQAAWVSGQRGGQQPRPAPHSRPSAPSYQPSRQAPRQQAAPQYRQPAPQYRQPSPQYRQPGPQYRQPAPQYRQPAPQYGNRPQGNVAPRPMPGYPSTGARPAYRPGYPGPAYPGSGNPGSAYPRPTNPGYTTPGGSPPGHLGSWLNEHRTQPVQEQERTLRNDPSFNHLAPFEQQRVVRQLHQVDQMPAQQRERRL